MSSSGIAIKSSQREFQCPRCGTQESTGDCQHVKSRAQALARQEGGSAEDLVHLCDCSSRVLDAVLEVLDLLNVGGAMTSLSGQLLVANRAAEQILAARDGLELSPFGELYTPPGSCSPSLSALMERAAAAALLGTPRPADTALTVQRPSGKRPLKVVLHTSSPRLRKSAPSEGVILLLIEDPNASVEADEAEVRQLYGLTPTEARLASLLTEGKSLKECCDQLAIRVSTGRMHLEHLFSKTDVYRQSQLVTLLLKSVFNRSGLRAA